MAASGDLWRILVRVVGAMVVATGGILVVRDAVLTEEHSPIPGPTGGMVAISGSFHFSFSAVALCVAGGALIALTFWSSSGKRG